MSDVTRILSAIEQGDAGAAEQLLPLVYDELRKLAAQKMAAIIDAWPGQAVGSSPTAGLALFVLTCAHVQIEAGETRWGQRQSSA
jgi:hypothetical protein